MEEIETIVAMYNEGLITEDEAYIRVVSIVATLEGWDKIIAFAMRHGYKRVVIDRAASEVVA
jgi:hypothetical protein